MKANLLKKGAQGYDVELSSFIWRQSAPSAVSDDTGMLYLRIVSETYWQRDEGLRAKFFNLQFPI